MAYYTSTAAFKMHTYYVDEAKNDLLKGYFGMAVGYLRHSK
jgi:hypothetical protein